jgi:hypothetical protein
MSQMDAGSGTKWILLCIDYWSESVICFDPEKVVGKFADAFPDIVIDWTNASELEVQRVQKFLMGSDASEETKATMLRQIKGKASRNGPVYNFQIPQGKGCFIKGQATRYSVTIHYEGTLPDQMKHQLVDLLRSLEAGKLSIDHE